MKEIVNYWGFKLAFFLALLLGSVSFVQFLLPPMEEAFGIIPAIIVLILVCVLYGRLGRIVFEWIREKYNNN
jgi:ABC-type nitrate/sulfonate/bicarbonate transport system permease component